MRNESTKGSVTAILDDLKQGDRSAADRLWPLIHDELRALARKHLRYERGGPILQTTMLVNEVFLRIADHAQVDWQGRAHFFAVAAQVIRRILVDWVRYEGRAKRSAPTIDIELAVEEPVQAPGLPSVDLLALDEALTRLAEVHARSCMVVQLRFFAGLSIEEIAEVLGVGTRTVNADWQFARTWLHRELTRGTHE